MDPAPVAALAALFDNGLPAPQPGDDLPPLWHWVALPRWPVSAELGPDGHPARGTFLPAIDLPRRMFAGGEVLLHHAPKIGETVTRRSIVDSVTEKSGRSGKLVIVVVRTVLSDVDGSPLIEERQDIVYREASATTSEAPIEPADLAGSPFRRSEDGWDFATDPSLLMRFSAATANPHRIHYDWPYATRVEGYPGLVVHGPLMSLALAEVLRLDSPGARVTRLAHRNLAPLFCGQPAQLRTEPRPGGATLTLVGAAGPRTSLEADYEEGPSHA
ncbi:MULTISPECIES: MaoC family dehydratase N-terminal domain-containing protein [Actinomycetes]|uniref:FAS1-like dehydratase domain-containing protein n=1 Tax=Actinomycetes TaxID=1760 RepID=UPI0002F0C44A|nr:MULTISPECIES: MaoC family dehydratase N-terminal domain-containing protein [Actinomycetes]